MRNLILLVMVVVVIQGVLYISGLLPLSVVVFLGCILMGVIVFSKRIYFEEDKNERRILLLKGLVLGLGFYMLTFLPKLIS